MKKENIQEVEKKMQRNQQNIEYRENEISDIFHFIDEITHSISYNLDENINGFHGPFEAVNNDDYEKQLKEKLKRFKEQIDKPAYYRKNNLVEEINNICDKVLKAHVAGKEGKKDVAEKYVLEILQEYKMDPFVVTELDKSYAFRGMAPFESHRSPCGSDSLYEDMLKKELRFFRARVVDNTEKLSEMKDINYLPYSKKEKAVDMRFSSRNKICFYLGVSSYVCSKECRWNGEKNLYLSSVKFNEEGKKLKILNLIVSDALINGMISDGKNERQEQLHISMLKVFPLMIATMFTIRTCDKEREEIHKETYKAEYFLSQVIMEVLSKEGIDGVAYMSRQTREDFNNLQMVCLAIPVIDVSDENEYGNLVNTFEMTNPVLYSCEMVGKDSYGSKASFSEIDEYLVNLNHEKFTQHTLMVDSLDACIS